tara:strand:+ start:1075 stop:2187 length:1113 start_codon:yes stop_codon:yes gene_type:complete
MKKIKFILLVSILFFNNAFSQGDNEFNIPTVLGYLGVDFRDFKSEKLVKEKIKVIEYRSSINNDTSSVQKKISITKFGKINGVEIYDSLSELMMSYKAEYDDRSNLIKEIVCNYNKCDSTEWFNTYDKKNRLSSSLRGDSLFQFDLSYDADENITLIHKHNEILAGLNRATYSEFKKTITYDANMNLIQTDVIDGDFIYRKKYKFNNKGNATFETWDYFKKEEGNDLLKFDYNLHEYWYIYDSKNKLSKKIYNMGSSTNVTVYIYDNENNLKKEKEFLIMNGDTISDNETSFTYYSNQLVKTKLSNYTEDAYYRTHYNYDEDSLLISVGFESNFKHIEIDPTEMSKSGQILRGYELINPVTSYQIINYLR